MSDIIPVVPYDDIKGAHDFLVSALGFESVELVEDGDGNVVHGEVQLDGRRIWLHANQGGITTPRAAGVETGGITVLVPDVDALCARAKAAGATITREPADADYGYRECAMRDAEGHSWWLMAPLA